MYAKKLSVTGKQKIIHLEATRIILIGKENDDDHININRWLVDNKWAKFDQNSRYIKNIEFMIENEATTTKSPSTQEPNVVATENDDFDSLELITSSVDKVDEYADMFNLPHEFFKSFETTKTNLHISKLSDKLNQSTSTNSDDRRMMIRASLLDYVTEVPKVCWHQTEELIILNIEIGDNENYNLNVTPESLFFT